MDTIDTRDASLTDAERADIYLDIIARIRDHLMSVRDSVAEEWMAEVVAFPSSVIGLAEARMQQITAPAPPAGDDTRRVTLDSRRRVDLGGIE